MKLIQDAFAGIVIGSPQAYRNLVLFPLLESGPCHAVADYLLLDEALEKDLARVTEISQAGSVPELAFENVAADPVLLVDGDLRRPSVHKLFNLPNSVGVSSVLSGEKSFLEAAQDVGKSVLDLIEQLVEFIVCDECRDVVVGVVTLAGSLDALANLDRHGHTLVIGGFGHGRSCFLQHGPMVTAKGKSPISRAYPRLMPHPYALRVRSPLTTHHSRA